MSYGLALTAPRFSGHVAEAMNGQGIVKAMVFVSPTESGPSLPLLNWVKNCLQMEANGNGGGKADRPPSDFQAWGRG